MISLTASENYMSVSARVSLATRMGANYFFAPPYPVTDGEWFFPNSSVPEELARQWRDISKRLFDTVVADWRPNGGSTAENAILSGVCDRGSAIVHFAHADGGHFAIEPYAASLGVKVYHLPVDQISQEIDTGALAKLCREHPEIRLVLLDQSFILRQQPLRRIKEALPDGVLLAYDCSHVAALIAGGEFDQPLTNGADILMGNTHKTLPGPQKAFIGYAQNDKRLIRSISEKIVPGMQSNSHFEALMPMLITFKEMELFGTAYANQIVRNAKAFAHALVDEGFSVSGESFGYTETHQVHIVIGNQQKAVETVQCLHRCGIRSNPIEIPGSYGNFGIRLGVQAMTRRGMKEPHFQELARFFKEALFNKKKEEEMRALVLSFGSEFPLFPLAYSFDCYCKDDFVKNFLTEVLK